MSEKKLDRLIEAMVQIAEQMPALMKRSMARSIRVGFADKLKIGKLDAIVSVQVGREIPDDVDRETWFAEYEKLKTASRKLVLQWEDEIIEEMGE